MVSHSRLLKLIHLLFAIAVGASILWEICFSQNALAQTVTPTPTPIPPFSYIAGLDPFVSVDVPGRGHGRRPELTELVRGQQIYRWISETVSAPNFHIYTQGQTIGKDIASFDSPEQIVVTYRDLQPQRSLDVGLYQYIDFIQPGDTFSSIRRLNIHLLQSWEVKIGENGSTSHQLSLHAQLDEPGYYALLACYSEECNSGKPNLNMGFGTSSSEKLLISVQWPEIFYATFQIKPSEVSENQNNPVSSEACNYKGHLIEETIPDGTVVTPGEEFTKTWTVQNDDICTWGPGHLIHTLKHVGGNWGFGITVIPLEREVPPNGIVTIQITMRAPQTPGDYRNDWELSGADGQYVRWGARGLPTLFTEIRVP